MTDVTRAVDDVAKRRRGIVAAVLGIVVVIAALGAAAYIFDLWPFGELPGHPATQAGGTSREETKTAEPTSTPAPAPSVTLPPLKAQQDLYWEQVASAKQINDLVDNKFASFELSQPSALADTADIRVKGNYRDGSTLEGWLLLHNYSDKWYFAMITRDGNPWTTPVTGEADLAVAKAIAEGNAANQEIPEAIIAGGYTLITIDKVTAGSGTAIVECTFSGGSGTAKGEITCIAKDEKGTRHWFITGFAKS